MLLENQFGALGTVIQDRMDGAFGELSPSASSLLITLLNTGSLTVSVLAGIIGVSQPTASRLIGGLETRGCLKRAMRDGRTVTVSLTAPGRKSAQSLQAIRADILNDLLRPLEARERATFTRLIDKILFTATGSRAAARTACRYCDHGVCNGEDCPINRRATRIEESASP